jgi:phage gpG-like protein
MAGTTTIRVRSRIPQLTAALAARAAAATAKATFDMEMHAKALCMSKGIWDTGNLVNSINSKVKGLEGSVHSPAEYSVYVEFGSKHPKQNYNVAARPYMIPAKELVEPKYKAALSQLI